MRSAVLGAAALLSMAAPSAVMAQAAPRGPNVRAVSESFFARDRNVSVSERPQPEYDALGVHLGGFYLDPRITIETEANDNIYGLSGPDRQKDLIVHLRPQLNLRSDWSRHALGAFARATVNRFLDHGSQNSEEFGVGSNARLDVVRGANVSGDLSYQDLVEPRTAPTALGGAATPTRYGSLAAGLGGVREFNRIRISARTAVNRLDYRNAVFANGAPLIQDDRDRTVWSQTARVEYALSPATAIFISGALESRNYRLAADAGGFDRDSNGGSASAGANFDITDVVRGEVGVGYLSRDYKDPRFATERGLAVSSRLEWFPTQLTTVTFNASRSIEEGTVRGASGFFYTTTALQVDHELLRNLILSASGSMAWNRYREVDRLDRLTAASLGATYKMNRRIGMNLSYNYYRQSSSGQTRGPSFSVNRVLLALILQI